MVTTAELNENSRQGFEVQKPPVIGLEAWLSQNSCWGCGHIYDETPVGLAVYVRNNPVKLVDPEGKNWGPTSELQYLMQMGWSWIDAYRMITNLPGMNFNSLLFWYIGGLNLPSAVEGFSFGWEMLIALSGGSYSPGGYSAQGSGGARSGSASSLTIADNISRHSTLGIDQVCGSRTGGACTLITGVVVVSRCQQSGTGIIAMPELRIYGDMYVYSGPFTTLRRTPTDRTVVDAQSAINHEYNVHINPAIASVAPLINSLAARAFDSVGQCQMETSAVSTVVGIAFTNTLIATQQQELSGGRGIP